MSCFQAAKERAQASLFKRIQSLQRKNKEIDIKLTIEFSKDNTRDFSSAHSGYGIRENQGNILKLLTLSPTMLDD